VERWPLAGRMEERDAARSEWLAEMLWWCSLFRCMCSGAFVQGSRLLPCVPAKTPFKKLRNSPPHEDHTTTACVPHTTLGFRPTNTPELWE
jgi:hypothetical protein